MCSSSQRSFSSTASSVSFWVETDMYSPPPIDSAPATRPASPAISTALFDACAPATPTTRPAVEMIPSFAPSAPARSQFSRLASAPAR